MTIQQYDAVLQYLKVILKHCEETSEKVKRIEKELGELPEGSTVTKRLQKILDDLRIDINSLKDEKDL